MSYLVVSGICVYDIKVLGDSTSDKKDKLDYEEWIKDHKSSIADTEDEIRDMEQVLGGRGESSIIRYY